VNFAARMQQEDKAQHIICAFMLVVLLLPVMSLYWACAAVLLAGLAKEGWDSCMGTGFCWYDIAANVIGVLLALALMMQV
jgi:hypothetical protein